MKPPPVLVLGLAMMLLVLSIGVGTASAAGGILCKSNQTPCSAANHYPLGSELKFSLKAGTKVVKPGPGYTLECGSSSGSGKTISTGSESSPVEITLSALSYTCANGCPTGTSSPGTMTVQHIDGVMSGKVRWANFEIKESCNHPIGECVWAGEVSKGVTLKGGNPATLVMEKAVLPKKSGSAYCPSGTQWSATYEITTPTPIYVSGSSTKSVEGAGVLCEYSFLPTCGLAQVYGAGTSIGASLKAATTSVIEAGFATVKCEESTLQGEVVSSGGSAEPVIGGLSSLSFGKCNCKVSVLKHGGFSVDWTNAGNGALKLEGVEIAIDCGGKECILAGDTGGGITLEEGMPASIKAKEAPVPKKSGVAECSSTAKWTAEYEVTAPQILMVLEG